MRARSLWQSTLPSPQALASSEPFAIDTLDPEQWLQWIFIPRMQTLIRQQQPLPSGFAITPYFEQCWQGQQDKAALITLLMQIDKECGE